MQNEILYKQTNILIKTLADINRHSLNFGKRFRQYAINKPIGLARTLLTENKVFYTFDELHNIDLIQYLLGVFSLLFLLPVLSFFLN